ncbi:MAG: hypothetical protein GDA51_02190 [Ekhidna sp.]|nr:hypothetical protein [Ekhidna sp.]MBC6410957.1 hypothetical protein [Ekhidna sp.]MBC6425285.1 hypothetical protein [Ekhidna sp.]
MTILICKNSGIWSAFSGTETYKELQKYSGYNIQNWVNKNIKWTDDLEMEFVRHLKENDLIQYLNW